MRRVVPSMLVSEELDNLLAGGVDEETYVASAFVDTVNHFRIELQGS